MARILNPAFCFGGAHDHIYQREPVLPSHQALSLSLSLDQGHLRILYYSFIMTGYLKFFE